MGGGTLSVGGSENCAASAASWAEVLLQLRLEDGAPREDGCKDLLLLRIVGRGDDVSFLTATGVHARQSLVHNDSGVFVTEGVHRVDAGHGHSLLSGRVRELARAGASSVADDSGDTAGSVGMRLLMECDTDEQVRGDVSVEPFVHIAGQLVPVAVTSAHRGAERVGAASAAGVPDGLVAHVADVLGSAAHSDHLRGLSVHLEVVDLNKELLPGAFVGASFGLDIIKGHVTVDDRLLTVEQSEDLVSLENLGLVGGDRDDLAPLQSFLQNPLFAVLHVLVGVAILELHESRRSRGSCC